MSKVQKAIEISDAKIQFVSLVDKAANKRQFLVTKGEDGQAQISTYSKILKVDADTHYITGIVYEPMTEDAHGNYMTEEEIRKAAYWFAKNSDSIDLQHSFETADGLAVVENYVAPSDMTIGDTPIVKGSWIITVECANDEVWQAVQKGELTGFSMGGIGKYSEEDVALENVTKGGGPAAEKTEKKGLLKRLGELLGMDIVEKGEVLDRYNESTKYSAFWNAMWALEDVLYRYNWTSDRYEFASDEATIREALTDFNSIITTILADSSIPIIKAVALPVTKAGKKMSSSNKAKLDEICQALSDFKSTFDEDEEEGTIEKEEHPMNRTETEAIVGQAVRKALEDAGLLKAAPAPAAGAETPPAEPVAKEAAPVTEPQAPAAAPAPDLDAAVEKAVEKALIKMGLAEETPDPDAPITRGDVEEIVKSAIEPMLKAFSVPSNLNNQNAVEKSENTHFLHGIL